MSIALTALILGCETAPPPPAEPEAPACDLSLDALAGKSFVQHQKQADGSIKEDLWARAHFYDEGGKLKLKYNTRSMVNMYTYSCAKDGKEQLCKVDQVDADQFCKTLVANVGMCTAEAVAEYAGVSLDDARKAKAGVDALVKKLTPDQMERFKVQFSNPNNQLRGVFHARIDTEACKLAISDTYETMTFGQFREVGNVVGQAKFGATDKDLVFEDCTDQHSLIAAEDPAKDYQPGESKLEWAKAAAIPFKVAGKSGTKAEADCAYSMDTWALFEPLGKAVAVTPDAKGKLVWSFQHAFDQPGRGVVHMYRYKACKGGAPERMDVLCAAVKVN
jgi:hypothetical protein